MGTLAKRQATLNPDGTPFSVKRFIGRKYSEVGSELKIVPYKVIDGPNGAVRFSVSGKEHAPEEISASVLKKLVNDASSYLGEKITDVVITVPAYFNDAQRQSTKDAGTIAGLNVLRWSTSLLRRPLPTVSRNRKSRRSWSSTLAAAHSTSPSSTSATVWWKCFQRQAIPTSAATISTRSSWTGSQMSSARKTASTSGRTSRPSRGSTKERRRPSASFHPGHQPRSACPSSRRTPTVRKHLNMAITRAKFDQLTAPLVERCVAPVKDALSAAKLTEKEIDEVVLVGGSTRIPAVQDLVKKLTGGKQPNMSVNPDEVVAVGAAVQAGIISGEMKDVLLLDVIPLSLGVETMGGVMTKLIDKNTTIPCKKTETFSTAADNQPAVDIVVLQGEREMASDNRILGNFKLEGIRQAPRGIPQIEVTFDVDANGILNVGAKDRDTGKEQRITINGSTNLDKSEVERMIREAQEHSADDRKKKEFAEARNDLEASVYQLEKMLGQTGPNVPENEKARARSLVEEGKAALGKSDSTLEALKVAASDVKQMIQILSSSSAEGPEPQPASSAKDDDNVVDAEFVDGTGGGGC